MVSRIVRLIGSGAAALLAAGAAAAQGTNAGALERPVSEAELRVLAAAYQRGDLGSGNCAWLHPVDESPTTLPCELVPLPLLSQMARSNANKHAQLEMGKRYEEGRGLAQDYAKARRFYRMAGRDLKRGHVGTAIEAGLGRPRTPGHLVAAGLPEARKRLRRLFLFDPQVSPPWSNAPL